MFILLRSRKPLEVRRGRRREKERKKKWFFDDASALRREIRLRAEKKERLDVSGDYPPSGTKGWQQKVRISLIWFTGAKMIRMDDQYEGLCMNHIIIYDFTLSMTSSIYFLYHRCYLLSRVPFRSPPPATRSCSLGHHVFSISFSHFFFWNRRLIRFLLSPPGILTSSDLTFRSACFSNKEGLSFLSINSQNKKKSAGTILPNCF